MKSTASAPAKIILFGEHFVVHGAKSLLCSINRRIYVESELTENKIKISSSLGSLEVKKNVQIKNIDPTFRPLVYLAKKALRLYRSNKGLKITIKSEIPAGVGLGSSSACSVAAACSIFGLFSKLSKSEVLNLAIEAEKTVFEQTSGADTTVCTFGGIIEFAKDKNTKLKITPAFKIIVADSGIPHFTSKVVARVKKFKETHPDEFYILCHNQSSLVDDALVDIKQNDIISLGKKMFVNHAHLQKIGVSNFTLDEMVKLAGSASYGAKITGAGDGGCIIALVDEKNQAKAIKALSSKYCCFVADIDTKGVVGSCIKTV